jgi:predicted RNA-binding protein with PIN domain
VHYLIDGYNLFFRTTRGEEGSHFQTEREKIIIYLSEQLEIAKLQATLVFDAAWQEGPSQTKIKGSLEIHYTESGESADDWIVSEVKRSALPIEVTVVTSDRNLAWRSRNKGAQTIHVEDFMKFVRRLVIKKSRAAPPKPTPSQRVVHPKPLTDLERYEQAFAQEPEEPKEPGKKAKRKEIKPFEPPLNDYERWLKAFEDGA